MLAERSWEVEEAAIALIWSRALAPHARYLADHCVLCHQLALEHARDECQEFGRLRYASIQAVDRLDSLLSCADVKKSSKGILAVIPMLKKTVASPSMRNRAGSYQVFLSTGHPDEKKFRVKIVGALRKRLGILNWYQDTKETSETKLFMWVLQTPHSRTIADEWMDARDAVAKAKEAAEKE